jgi:hypothetical protein
MFAQIAQGFLRKYSYFERENFRTQLLLDPKLKIVGASSGRDAMHLLMFDSKLTWKQHIIKKRKQVNITIKQLNWLLDRKSNLAIENKLLVYKTIIIAFLDVWSGIMGLWQ